MNIWILHQVLRACPLVYSHPDVLEVLKEYTNGAHKIAGPQGEQGPAGTIQAQSCPTGQFVTGFNSLGQVICNTLLTPIDLAVANSYSSNVSVLLGTGSDSFSAATNFAVGSIRS